MRTRFLLLACTSVLCLAPLALAQEDDALPQPEPVSQSASQADEAPQPISNAADVHEEDTDSAQTSTFTPPSGLLFSDVSAGPQIENLPPIPSEPTHPALRLTSDKSEIITFDKRIKSVVVGNEYHARVLMDGPQRVVVVPRIPGATFFTVLAEDGSLLMQRHVIIATKENYVRIRKTCALATTDSCNVVSSYYCPDGCHEVWAPVSLEKNNDKSGSSGAGAQQASSASPALPGSTSGGQDEGSEE